MPRTTFQSLGGLFASALKRFQARTALVAPSGARVTYRELDDQSNRLANALADRGVGPGSVVAILLRNCTEFVIADLAVMKLGAAKVPLNSLLAPNNVAYMLRHSNAIGLIVHTSLAHLLPDSEADLETIVTRIAVTDSGSVPASFTEWSSLLDASSVTAVRNEAPPEAVGLIIYTGGTTGEPKGVVHGQAALVHNILSQVIMSEITAEERMLITTPLPHAAHLLCQAGLLRGATVWITEGFDPLQTLDLIRTERLTWCFMVPTMIYRLLDALETHSSDISSLRTVLYGASPISRPKLVRALERFGPIFLQVYGQTEAPNFITTLSKSDHLVPELQLSCGQPVLATQVRIAGPEGNELPLGEIGEVQVRSVYTLAAYHRDPETSEAAYSGEWLRTGDLGFQQATGHVFLVDRLKDMVISGGMNVYSREVEHVIQTFSGVSQVVVIGIPDPKWGEAVAAFVVLSGASIEPEALLEHCRARLDRYKVPKQVNIVSQIPLTAYGKPDKKALRARYWSGQSRSIG